MTDRTLSMPMHGSVTCVQLPRRGIAVASYEMAKTSGGFRPIGMGVNLTAMACAIAEAIFEYFDETD
ncbi:MAG: hypothetical protein OYM47_16875 [Gemmatimonadota bacterium]|nr:hypothetical protein [Gemmatimonadota bacterium]